MMISISRRYKTGDGCGNACRYSAVEQFGHDFGRLGLCQDSALTGDSSFVKMRNRTYHIKYEVKYNPQKPGKCFINGKKGKQVKESQF